MAIAFGKARLLILGLVLLCSQANAKADVNSVHIRGSTTLTPLMQKIAEAYMAEHADARIVISSGGTERGYKSVVDGTADIAMASGEIPDSIASECARKNITLKKNLVGYATIIVVAHPSNPVSNLNVKQLKDIFTGRITRWNSVGGKDAPINLYVGPPTGGINETWKSVILGDTDTYTPAGIVLGNAERLRAIEAQPNGITFLTLDDSNYSRLKILSVNNIAPDKASVNDGRYALRAPLMLVTSTKPSRATRDFIQYFIAPERASFFSQIVKPAGQGKEGRP